MSSSFLFVGNGPNHNRGCEAIGRGTLAILREAGGDYAGATTGVIAADAIVLRQNSARSLNEPEAFALKPQQKSGWTDRLRRALLKSRPSYDFPGLDEHLPGVSAVLEVGGDNYTLDYGRPYVFLDLDKHVKSSGKPLVIWGASIGPFDTDPEFDGQIMTYLRSVDHVFVRETVSLEYLQDRGLENVTLMADPAILMPPEEPKSVTWDLDKGCGAIGLNLSPFQARKFAPGPIEYWQLSTEHLGKLAEFGAENVNWLVRTFDRPVLLVPHVIAPEQWNDDHRLLEAVLSRVDAGLRSQVQCLPPTLNAAETKWAIGQCSAFAGSRTHSTIAAFSSRVPVLAFGYSRKAVGIMRDVYGHDELCLPSAEFETDSIRRKFKHLIDNRSAHLEAIDGRLPEMRSNTLSAGKKVMELAA